MGKEGRMKDTKKQKRGRFRGVLEGWMGGTEMMGLHVLRRAPYAKVGSGCELVVGLAPALEYSYWIVRGMWGGYLMLLGKGDRGGCVIGE